MNEEPSEFPDRPPEPPRPQRRRDDDDSSPSFWAMVAVGVGLLILSGIVCASVQNPAPFIIGAVGAFVSLFFRGYRGIFIGFVGTIALAYLALIIICGAMGFPRFQ
jgi:hypothetical protein